MRDQPHKETTKVSFNYDEKFIYIKKMNALMNCFSFQEKHNNRNENQWDDNEI